MRYTEQRMNNYGKIRILTRREYLGTPVAYDLKNEQIVAYKNLSLRLKTFLMTDGLTQSETIDWLSKCTELEPETYKSKFYKFSRSLDWGISKFSTNHSLLDAFKISTNIKDITTNSKSFYTTDILITRKFKIYYLQSSETTRTTEEYEEIYVHILLGKEPKYKGIFFTYNMFPFSLDDDRAGLQIVENANPNLKKSLNRKTAFAYTLDAIKHTDDIKNTPESSHIYEIWHNPKNILLSNQHISPTNFHLYLHTSNHLITIENSLNEWLLSLRDFCTRFYY